MNRFIWLVRREVWEHKAIWVAPAIVIGCLVLLVLTGNVHLGPIGDFGDVAVRHPAGRRAGAPAPDRLYRASRSSWTW